VPNPVGIDKYFEGLCPPYCTDMREAVQKFADLKFGPNGAFDPERPGPYRENSRIKSRVERYTPEFIELMARSHSTSTTTSAAFPRPCEFLHARVCAGAALRDGILRPLFRRGFLSRYARESHGEVARRK